MQNHEQEESILVPTIVFSLAAFMGVTGIAVTGFGMAIIYLLVYTVADLANLVECSKCTLRDAVFFQSLALGAAIPLMLFNTRKLMKTHLSKELLVTFIPATVIGTPIGNFLQDHLPADVFRTIVGAVITLLICYQLTKIIPKSELYQRFKQQKEEVKQSDDVSTKEIGDDLCEKAEEGIVVNQDTYANDDNMNDDKNHSIEKITQGMAFQNPGEKDEENHNDDKENQSDLPEVALESEKVSPDLLALFDKQAETEKKCLNETQENDLDENILQPTEAEEENIPTGLKLRIWGFILGLLSGFLGGLMGVRGPPLMVFFLMFEYPKNIVRANAVIILLVNISIRIAYYIVEDVSGKRDDPWFDSDYSVLYICSVVFGMLGVPIGNYIGNRMNQQQFKLFVAILLLFAGLSNLIKGSINLASS